MTLYEFEGKRPEVHPDAFVHPEAMLIGGVTLGADCYVGPGRCCGATGATLSSAKAPMCRRIM